MMRLIGAAFLASTLIVSGAFASGNTSAPLPVGKPAGVKQAAALDPNMFLVLLSAGIILGGITLAVCGANNNCVTTPSTTTSTAGLP